MKARYPRAGLILAMAVLLANIPIARVYAESETDLITETEIAAGTEVTEESDTVWKAEISDYDSSLSLTEYEEITPSEAEIEAMEEATTLRTYVSTVNETLASSDASGSVDTGAAVSLGSPSSGEFAFTTYGYGHCVGMSQNGANYYAIYGGYDYQSILFHYYPGTTLVQGDTDGTITVNGVTGSVLDMVSMMVYAEMGSDFAEEALKAQAVAAFTYVMYYDGNATGVAIKEDPPQNVIDAVSSVLGQALYYDGSYALTLFGASSGGATASSYDIFGTYHPYLVSVTSEYDAEYDPYYGVVTYMTVDEVRSCIESAYGITLSSDTSNWIQVVIGDSGYVQSVVIDGQKTVSGYSFSNALGLRSAKFAYAIG